MKNLLVFASAMMVGAAAFAQNVPRVYAYSASLNTTVAKNAAKVTLVDKTVSPAVKSDNLDVCYRVKGKVTVKGVFVLDCFCYDQTALSSFAPGGVDFALFATSADKYTWVDNTESNATVTVWSAARLGNALSSKASVSELGFDVTFDDADAAALANDTDTNNDNCYRSFSLSNAGFGSAKVIEKLNPVELDIYDVKGNVVGVATPPICSAKQSNCPRCVGNGTCKVAIAYNPCVVDDWADLPDGAAPSPYDGTYNLDPYTVLNGAFGTDVAFGTFTLKYNASWSKLISTIDKYDSQNQPNFKATAQALLAKAIGKSAVNPF
jgi:hypothetical protein